MYHDSERPLIITEKVINLFTKYEQKKGYDEAGGILLGNVTVESVIISDVTTPNRFDVRNILYFVRAKIPAQLRVNNAWKESRGTTIYLGEWHTHQEISPNPSQQDIEMIRKVFNETIMEINFIYLIIVGLNSTYWVGKQTRNGLIKLEMNGKISI